MSAPTDAAREEHRRPDGKFGQHLRKTADDVRLVEPRTVDAPGSFWDGAEIIHVYTRADALADGVLKDTCVAEDGSTVDLNRLAREAGIPVPVAFTSAAHHDTVAWPQTNAGLQDEVGRAWDVLNMANLAARARSRAHNGALRVGDRIPFQVARVPNTRRATVPRTTTLHAVFGVDEDGQPCFTIMLPDED